MMRNYIIAETIIVAVIIALVIYVSKTINIDFSLDAVLAFAG